MGALFLFPCSKTFHGNYLETRQPSLALDNGPARIKRTDEDANDLEPEEAIAQSDNYALIQARDRTTDKIKSAVMMMNNQGLVLRDVGHSPKQIERNARLFGYDRAPIAFLRASAGKIADQFQALIDNVVIQKLVTRG